MNDKHEELQERLFERKYRGATLANIDFSDFNTEKIRKWMDDPKGFLVLTGPPGTGKTYFCASLLEILPNKIRNIRAYNERDLLARVRKSINDYQNGDYIQELHYLLDDDLIMIDDIGSAKYNEWREEILMESIDYRYATQKPTVITSNLSKEDFESIYHNRISSRLFASENTIIDMFGMPDLRKQGL